MQRLAIAGLCLFWASLVVLGRVSEPHAQFDYRGHHAEAAAKVLGSPHSSQHARGGQPEPVREAPRLKERQPREQQQQEPERWSQFVPHGARSVEAEISEARREAREMEERRYKAEQEEERQRKDVAKEREQERKSSRSPSVTPSNPIQRGVENVKTATRKTRRRAQNKLRKLLLEHDDDDDHDDDDEEDDEDDFNGGGVGRSGKGRRKFGLGARMWHAVVWLFTISYHGSAWSGRHLLWTPMTYAGEAIRWSAHTSWRTTRWTGERALVGPALTAGAPLIYLAEGLLFLFVFIPARIVGIVARELYPVYIYLGAALAVGTAMGIGSALILFAGSFLLSDTSKAEQNLSHRADMIPEDLQRRFRQRKKKASPAKKWAKKGESIIERAIKESVERGKRERQYGRAGLGQELLGSPVATESDEDDDDDYFGDATTASYKGKSRSNDATPTGPMRRNPAHFGPSLPVGATAQGGWNTSRSDSSSSTPAASPIAVRPNAPNVAPFAYASARAIPSPMTSPDVLRSPSSRLRRGINSSS